MDEIPKGFVICRSDEPNCELVSYKSSGMGCILVFLATALIWVGGGFALIASKDPAAMRQLLGMPGASIGFGCGFAAMIYFLWFLMFHLFGVTDFVLQPSQMLIDKRLFGLSSRKLIERSKMQYVEQIKDGGTGDDSFPSWGLNFVAGKRYKLLTRQPIVKSDWLGRKLATYYGVDFKPCSSRE